MAIPTRPSIRLLLAGTAFIYAPAFAASADDGVASSETTRREEIVVTASGYEQEIANAPASISVISREDLENRPYTSLEDAVRHIEGVSINGENNGKDIVIRGMPGEYSLIMLDGRRQSTRETMNRGTGGVQANLLPPLAAIERIEVVRGPMSSLYGSDAMGGVINVITRKVPERASGTVTLGGIVQEDGDYGNTKLGNFWLGAPLLDGKVGIQVYGGLNDRGEDNIYFARPIVSGSNRVRDRNINAKLSVVLTPEHSLTFAAGHNYLAYRETEGKSIAAGMDAYEDRHKRNYYSLSYEGDWSFATSRLAVYREQEELEAYYAGELQNSPKVTNTTVDAIFNIPLGRSSLTVGGQYINARVTGISGQDNVAGYTNVDRVSRDSWAVFSEAQWRPLDALTITAGGRLDDHEQFGSHFTPRLYANLIVAPGVTLRGGIAGGFRAPTIRQSEPGYCMSTGGSFLPRGPLCGNADLKPETSTTKEIGVRYDGAGALSFGLTLFHTNFKNKVVSYLTDQQDPINPSRPWYVYDNVDRVVIKGIEASASVPVTQGVLLTANYTYTDSERRGGGEPAFDGSSLDGHPLDKTPKHMLNARLGWDVVENLNVYAAAFYTGKQYYSGFRNGATQTRTREGSTTFDIGATFRVNEHFTLRGAVLNITDKIVPVDNRGRFEGLNGNWMVDEGRRFWATAAVSF